MQVELILNLKKVMLLPHVSSIFKTISPKTFKPHCVVSANYEILLADFGTNGRISDGGN
jgi:hypothetical protein